MSWDVSTSFFFTSHEAAVIGKELAKTKPPPLLTLIFFSYVSSLQIKILNNYKLSKQKAPNLSIGKIIPIFGGSDKRMAKRIKKE
ncbi:hypothetical protein HYE06_02170 [Mycoplasmopsis bovis]|nr:hypothetical protein HYE06_02170 [Mycoplasmopsis bovis]